MDDVENSIEVNIPELSEEKIQEAK